MARLRTAAHDVAFIKWSKERRQHRPQQVLRLTEAILPAIPFGDQHVQVSMMAADAMSQSGRFADAIAILEATTAHRIESSDVGPHRWLNARAQLASLYRRVGRVQDADQVEHHLLTLLALADADSPLLMDIRQRVTFR